MTKKEYHVVYLTGAPATGKSTLLAALEHEVNPLLQFSYSKELAAHLSRKHGKHYSQDNLREGSAKIITPQDVYEVGDSLIKMVKERRESSHIVIDSHPVTKESYGFRVTPFTLNRLAQINPSIIIVLYTEPQVVIDRIASNNQGRPIPTQYEAAFHNDLQATVAMIYGIQVGIPIYLLNSAKPVEELVFQVCRRIQY